MFVCGRPRGCLCSLGRAEMRHECAPGLRRRVRRDDFLSACRPERASVLGIEQRRELRPRAGVPAKRVRQKISCLRFAQNLPLCWVWSKRRAMRARRCSGEE